MAADLLAGIRVLDLSQYIPGPFAARALADFGADVLKVEPPGGDPMRGFLMADPGGGSPIYRHLNAGKRIVRLDLKAEAGGAAFARLVARADVLIESYRPGVLDRLGFDRTRLVSLNPRLVHCALSGFGQTGPARLRAGHDITYLALAGGLLHTGTREAPIPPFPPAADHAGAMQAVQSILAALLRRERSGAGACLDVSLHESALAWQYLGALQPGLARGTHALGGGVAWYRVYATADGGFMALGAIEAKFWAAFCRAMERPDWIPRQHEPLPQDGLIGEVAARFASRPRAAWEAVFADVDCCCEPVLSPAEAGRSSQVQARGMAGGDGPVPHCALWLDGAAPGGRADATEIDAAAALDAWS